MRNSRVTALRTDIERVQEAVDDVSRAVRGVEGHVLKVAEAYQRISRSGQRKAQAYDQLYEELRQYKDNFLLQAQRPLFNDVLLLYDTLTRQLRRFEADEGPVERADVMSCLKDVLDEVLEVLYRRDIEPIQERPDTLDIDFQKPVKRIDTDEPSEDRQVVQIVREGFRMNGTVYRAQEVVVKRCVKERDLQ